MTRKEKCKLAIDKGFTYNPETGDITNRFGKIITGKFTQGYIQIKLHLDNKKYSLLAHQFAWYIIYNQLVDCIDHINGKKDDNRICNLRSVTNQQNAFNQTRAKGYSFKKNRNKYEAQIKVNGKYIHLGSFINETDARVAYLQAKEKYHKII